MDDTLTIGLPGRSAPGWMEVAWEELAALSRGAGWKGALLVAAYAATAILLVVPGLALMGSADPVLRDAGRAALAPFSLLFGLLTAAAALGAGAYVFGGAAMYRRTLPLGFARYALLRAAVGWLWLLLCAAGVALAVYAVVRLAGGAGAASAAFGTSIPFETPGRAGRLPAGRWLFAPVLPLTVYLWTAAAVLADRRGRWWVAAGVAALLAVHLVTFADLLPRAQRDGGPAVAREASALTRAWWAGWSPATVAFGLRWSDRHGEDWGVDETEPVRHLIPDQRAWLASSIAWLALGAAGVAVAARRREGR